LSGGAEQLLLLDVLKGDASAYDGDQAEKKSQAATD
jgi:hypothetical protein